MQAFRLFRHVLFTSIGVLIGCDVFLEDVGHLDQPCSKRETCHEGLVCLFGSCSAPPKEGELCDDLNQLKHPVCGDGFICEDGRCVAAGGKDEPCILFSWSSAECNSGLVCIDSLCRQTGGDDQPCRNPDEAGEPERCDDSMECISGFCKETGGLDQPCRFLGVQSGKPLCDVDLVCREDVCQMPLDEEVQQPNSSKVLMRCPYDEKWDGFECTESIILGGWSTMAGACPTGFQIPTLEDFIEILDECDGAALGHLVEG